MIGICGGTMVNMFLPDGAGMIPFYLLYLHMIISTAMRHGYTLTWTGFFSIILAQGYISFPSKGTSDGHCAEDFATSST
jgi:hypothetical protein